jgi:hypothetical protein
MTLNQIMFRVASAYPECLLDYWELAAQKPRRSTDGGDYVAKFVVHAIHASYDSQATDCEQTASAVIAVQRGADRLNATAHALANMSRECQAELAA